MQVAFVATHPGAHRAFHELGELGLADIVAQADQQRLRHFLRAHFAVAQALAEKGAGRKAVNDRAVKVEERADVRALRAESNRFQQGIGGIHAAPSADSCPSRIRSMSAMVLTARVTALSSRRKTRRRPPRSSLPGSSSFRLSASCSALPNSSFERHSGLCSFFCSRY